jgi:hypothetical protein
MIKKGNKPVLFNDVSCKFQIWRRALVIVSIFFFPPAVCHGTLVEKGWVIES